MNDLALIQWLVRDPLATTDEARRFACPMGRPSRPAASAMPDESKGLTCGACGSQTVVTRTVNGFGAVSRARRCKSCGLRSSTTERWTAHIATLEQIASENIRLRALFGNILDGGPHPN